MQDGAIANQDAGAAEEVSKAPLPLRKDTILGVCEALGEDFGFNPLWLRVPLAAGLLWNPLAIVGGYLAVGLVIALARFLFPRAPAAVPAASAQLEAAAEPLAAEAREEQEKARELIAA